MEFEFADDTGTDYTTYDEVAADRRGRRRLAPDVEARRCAERRPSSASPTRPRPRESSTCTGARSRSAMVRSRARRRRAHARRRRRRVPPAVVDDVRRVPRGPPALHRQHDDRRLQLRGARRTRGGRDRGRAVRRGRRRLRQHAAERSPARQANGPGRRWRARTRRSSGRSRSGCVSPWARTRSRRAGTWRCTAPRREQLAQIAVSTRQWAAMNPQAALSATRSPSTTCSRRRSSARRSTGSTAAWSPTAPARS